MQQIIGCSAKIILKNPKNAEENEKLLFKTDWKISQNGKDSANHHLQKDQRWSQIACYSQKTVTDQKLNYQQEAPVKHHCWKNGMCRIGKICQGTHRLAQKRNGCNILWTDERKIVSEFGHSIWVLNSSHSTLKTDGGGHKVSWFDGSVFIHTVSGLYIVIPAICWRGNAPEMGVSTRQQP